MNKFFLNPLNPAGFTAAVPLQRASKKTRKQVDKYLQGKDAYTLHKQVRKKFQRNKYSVSNIDELFQADLVELGSLKKYNDGYTFLLMVIDVFSKFAWARPLRTKSGTEVAGAFEDIFNSDCRIPVSIQTDRGKEFLARAVQQVFVQRDINFYVAKNPDVKAAVVERFNRTIKTRMFKYFTQKNTFRYIDVIQDIITSYNNSFHRTIGCEPSNVNSDNALAIWRRVYKTQPGTTIPRFKVGDYVRITRFKHVFVKGYERNWTIEVFKIVQVIHREPVVYKISDLADEIIDGTYYEPELQKIDFDIDKKFVISEIIKKRGRGKSKQCLVSWRGYPEKFNSWVKASDIQGFE